MSTYTPYPFEGAKDLQAVLDLIKIRPRERQADFPGILDLQEMLGTAAVQEHTVLWNADGGPLVGFTILDDYQSWWLLVLEVSSPSAGNELAAQMIAWSEHFLQPVIQERGPLPVEVHCLADHHDRIALLEASGFTCQSDGAVHMARDLAEPIPVPVLPDGFIIRPLAGKSEAEAWVMLNRAAWGTENMTVDYRLAMMETPSYEPALDLVAVAPDGSLAAACECFISAEENTLSGHLDGYTDPVITHPDYQRRGLAKALILTGLNLLKQRGMQTARLGTSSENVAMQRTAQAVGFSVKSETLFFAKTLALE